MVFTQTADKKSGISEIVGTLFYLIQLRLVNKDKMIRQRREEKKRS